MSKNYIHISSRSRSIKGILCGVLSCDFSRLIFVARRALLSACDTCEIAQHGRVARLNRLVNSNRAAGEIVTPPSITLPWPH